MHKLENVTKLIKVISILVIGGAITACNSGGTTTSVSGNNASTMTTAQSNDVSNDSVFIFSPYKDVGTSMDWWDDNGINTYVMSTTVAESSLTPLTEALPSTVNTVTWAFATGSCDNENWAGISPSDFAEPNVNSFVNNNKKYILSTGGSAGAFTCDSNVGMANFVARYYSPNLVGLDFDIEGYRISNTDVDNLISTIVYVKQQYPSLRISFTLATEAASDGSYTGLNSQGDYVVNAAKSAGLDFYVNLMTMDYGYGASSSICVVNDSTGQCDMGQSAIQAAKNLQHTYGIPNSRIEITPLIGDADVPDEVFTLDDADVVAQYVKIHRLAGLHYWSYDRDTPCTSTNNSNTTTCNLAPGVEPLSYTTTMAAYF